jgi:hypothetical protein
MSSASENSTVVGIEIERRVSENNGGLGEEERETRAAVEERERDREELTGMTLAAHLERYHLLPLRPHRAEPKENEEKGKEKRREREETDERLKESVLWELRLITLSCGYVC